MDLWMHEIIALERRERWLRAAAATRAADDARSTRHDRPDERPNTAPLPAPSTIFESLLAPIPVPRLLWPRDGACRPTQTSQSENGGPMSRTDREKPPLRERARERLAERRATRADRRDRRKRKIGSNPADAADIAGAAQVRGGFFTTDPGPRP